MAVLALLYSIVFLSYELWRRQDPTRENCTWLSDTAAIIDGELYMSWDIPPFWKQPYLGTYHRMRNLLGDD